TRSRANLAVRNLRRRGQTVQEVTPGSAARAMTHVQANWRERGGIAPRRASRATHATPHPASVGDKTKSPTTNKTTENIPGEAEKTANRMLTGMARPQKPIAARRR